MEETFEIGQIKAIEPSLSLVTMQVTVLSSHELNPIWDQFVSKKWKHFAMDN